MRQRHSVLSCIKQPIPAPTTLRNKPIVEGRTTAILTLFLGLGLSRAKAVPGNAVERAPGRTLERRSSSRWPGP